MTTFSLMSGWKRLTNLLFDSFPSPSNMLWRCLWPLTSRSADLSGKQTLIRRTSALKQMFLMQVLHSDAIHWSPFLSEVLPPCWRRPLDRFCSAECVLACFPRRSESAAVSPQSCDQQLGRANLFPPEGTWFRQTESNKNFIGPQAEWWLKTARVKYKVCNFIDSHICVWANA